MKRVVRAVLQHKDKLRAMAAEGQEFVLQHHTHTKLAEYLIGETLERS
ncbi:MAG: glycosyltransferase [Candidatus Methylacidiphilales bacterium]